MSLWRMFAAAAFVAVVFAWIPCGEAQGFGSSCKYEVFGFTKYYTCPQPGDNPKDKYCCGNEKYQRCCDKLFGVLDDETVKNITENAGAVVGIIVAIVLVIVIATVVCCCCCSCCLLAKMRKKRTSRNAHTAGAVQMAPASAGAYPVQQQPQHAPPQQQQQHHAPYMQQPSAGPYPNAGQPQYGGGGGSAPYPTNSGGYPGAYPAPYPAPYPGGQQPGYPMPDQPPPYSDYEKQPPFNPNYQP